jgi:hypothetical protein
MPKNPKLRKAINEYCKKNNYPCVGSVACLECPAKEHTLQCKWVIEASPSPSPSPSP